MKSQHTPAPWNIRRDYNDKDVLFLSGETGIIANFDFCKNNEPNVRLVSCAPQLLEFLEDMIRANRMMRGDYDYLVEKYMPSSLTKSEPPSRKHLKMVIESRASSVISKARGINDK